MEILYFVCTSNIFLNYQLPPINKFGNKHVFYTCKINNPFYEDKILIHDTTSKTMRYI